MLVTHDLYAYAHDQFLGLRVLSGPCHETNHLAPPLSDGAVVWGYTVSRLSILVCVSFGTMLTNFSTIVTVEGCSAVMRHELL